MLDWPLVNITEELASSLSLLERPAASFTITSNSDCEILEELQSLAASLPNVVRRKLSALLQEDRQGTDNGSREKIIFYRKEIEKQKRSIEVNSAKISPTEEERITKLICHLEGRLCRLAARTERVLTTVKASGIDTRNQIETDDVIPHQKLCEKLKLLQSCYADLCRDNRVKEDALETTKSELSTAVKEWTIKSQTDSELGTGALQSKRQTLANKECELSTAQEELRVLDEEYVAIIERRAQEEAARLFWEEETRKRDLAARSIQRSFRRWLLRRFIRRKRRKKKTTKTRQGDHTTLDRNNEADEEDIASQGQQSPSKDNKLQAVGSEGIQSVVVRSQRRIEKPAVSHVEEEETKSAKEVKERGSQTDGRIPKSKRVYKN